MQQASLLGLERLVGAFHVEIELRRPADRGAALGEVAFIPFREQCLVADDVRDKVEQALRHLLFDDEVRVLDDDLLADVIERHEDGPHPQNPLLHLAVQDRMALRLALLAEQRAVGDIARDRRYVERPIELIQPLVDEAQAIRAARHHARAEKGHQVAREGQHDGEDGGVLD